jgi:hypothetical protein
MFREEPAAQVRNHALIVLTAGHHGWRPKLKTISTQENTPRELTQATEL